LRIGDVDAVAGVVGESIVDHAVARLRERPNVDDDVEHLLVRVVVLGAHERVDVGEVRLRVLLDERRVAVARRAGGSADESEQRHQGHEAHAARRTPHDRSSFECRIR
jgi:hypothetical protein